MYSKAKLLGHPIHPMLVAFPIACYVGTLTGFAVYAADGHQFWLNLAIALNIVGVGSALLAALPGFVDLTYGVPKRSGAKLTGTAHAGLNLASLGLFLAILPYYVSHWNGPALNATLGLALSAAGVLLTLVAGALGWRLVQDYHVGIRLTPEQERDEISLQIERPTLRLLHRRSA